MNIKLFKEIILIFVITSIPMGFFLFYKETEPRRKIANTTPMDYSKLSDQQKLKWATIKKFSFQFDNDQLQIFAPHLEQVCENQNHIQFIFKAYNALIAGEHPRIAISISCPKNMTTMNEFNISFNTLKGLTLDPILKLEKMYIQSQLLYVDEVFPLNWSLQEIKVLGNWPYDMTEFEIRNVFNHNFEFQIR